jgi:uncharacterized protein YlxP (DUF503 family)
MIVGAVRWELALPGCASLKDKRMVVRSLKDRIHHRFKISVADTGHQDVWTRAQLAVAMVAGEGHHVDEVLDKVERLVEQDARVVVLERQRERY